MISRAIHQKLHFCYCFKHQKHKLQLLSNKNIKNSLKILQTTRKVRCHDNLVQVSLNSAMATFFFLPNQEHGTFFFHFASANNPRRHILSFNLALFILFCTFFLHSVWREMDKNHARHYPTPKLLRLLCFMGNAITFILFVVKIYFFFRLFSMLKLLPSKALTRVYNIL